jgi:hypothetical protein
MKIKSNFIFFLETAKRKTFFAWHGVQTRSTVYEIYMKHLKPNTKKNFLIQRSVDSVCNVRDIPLAVQFFFPSCCSVT